MRPFLLLACFTLVGCDAAQRAGIAPETATSARAGATLREAKQGFVTNIIRSGIIRSGPPAEPPETPQGSEFSLIQYPSPVGQLAAYLTNDPGDGKKHPAIIWITGGDNNSIGDVWSPQDRNNDQSVSAFRKAGIVVMFPSQRGGNANPGQREGFLGEVDDVLAAADFLAQQPYVDSGQIYLGGHSTGGTLVLLVAASSDRFRAVFSLGPVAAASHYGGEFVYCDPQDRREISLRSPALWLHCVQSPTYVIEGDESGNWESIQMMVRQNSNPAVRFFKVPGHDHFTVIAPLAEQLASGILQGRVQVTQEMLDQLR